MQKIIACILLISNPVFSDQAALEEMFTLKVQPLLSAKCFGCHGKEGEKIKGGFDLTSREGFLKGGADFHDALVPGFADKSYVMKMIRWQDEDYEMPPKENDRLTVQEIALVEDWINSGAIWPSEDRQHAIRVAERKKKWTKDGVIIETSGGLADEWTSRRYKPEDIWAFRPLKPVVVPAGEANPVDAFVRRKLVNAGFEFAGRAGLRTLIRRATYDLTGLPPTPQEVHDFVEASEIDADKAWSDLIDRLLASVHYGERWGQHWLDVARYADTGGFSNDYERSNAWRYRDYVIRAFNEDKPYNQFVIEQLSGDEMADRSVRKRLGLNNKQMAEFRKKGEGYTAEEAEWLVATSFLRMGPWDNAMVKKPEARQLYLDDVVNSVGQTFLATTMRCFKCHDHKFDPLPTRDYYRMYAAFETTAMAERPVPFTPDENLARFDEGKALVDELYAYADQKRLVLVEKREAAARKWYQENNREYLSLDKRRKLPDNEKPPRHCGLDHIEQGRLKVREQDEWIWNRRKERYQPMIQGVYNGDETAFGGARKLRIDKMIDPKWRPESKILMGGSLEAPGESVTPGVLSAVPVYVSNAGADDRYALPRGLEGRRSGLARWIAHPKNGLAVRSIVNRIWQYHFNKPIAGNPNNFGVKGAKPTHPQLLDWLAQDFVENGWRFKRLHKMIMTSKAYRQRGYHVDLPKLQVEDPNNDLLAYFPPRRLTAEELRDSTLLVSGELNRESGGLPVMPEINMEVALQPRMIQFSIAPAWQPSRTPEERNRRTIYAYRVRGMADPFLELFNQPNPNDSCEERDAAAVTPQALSLMNSATMVDRAVAFALRLERQSGNLGGNLEPRVRMAFHHAFQRQPMSEELSRLTRYVIDMQKYHRENAPEKVSYPTEITRSLVEEFSGKPFQYNEILPVFKDYVADMKVADVAPETRALADLCLLLFNSNEFMYVY